eukprot:11204013-Lingulodinium_polyedra.AAC.1
MSRRIAERVLVRALLPRARVAPRARAPHHGHAQHVALHARLHRSVCACCVRSRCASRVIFKPVAQPFR